ncbi:recombinase family protein [Cyanobium sp. PCC 7001]|uniref:recombinase family protein n=1 Tax=Cyanobium sp. PCC 7001 TaxID=180281 RepID=UPI00068161B0|nr:recombinase family protein [Cyanobium sp. PCC 7001]
MSTLYRAQRALPVGTGEDSGLQLVAYYRVSTTRQGESGLGLEAQRAKVQQLADSRRAVVMAEFVEVESGRKADRPQLAAALAEARRRSAAVAVAKLDRIARDAELVLRLSREAQANGMAGFLFCDLPDIDATTSAGRLILSVMASVAEFEARRISERTKEALAAAKARGVQLGGLRPNTIARNDAAKNRAQADAEALRSLLEPMAAQGYSLRQMASALAAAGTKGRTGRPLSPSKVRAHLERLGLATGGNNHLGGRLPGPLGPAVRPD